MSIIVQGIRIDGSNPPGDHTGAWSPKAYESDVGRWLHKIAFKKSGKLILDGLRVGTPVTIVPDNEPNSPSGRPSEAYLPDWINTRNITLEARKRKGDYSLGILERFDALKGSHGVVEITPSDWRDFSEIVTPDDIILHELCHCAEKFNGIMSTIPMRKHGMLSSAEVHSILISNIYRSEKGMTRFRLRHSKARHSHSRTHTHRRRTPAKVKALFGTLEDAKMTFRLGKPLIMRLAELNRSTNLYHELAKIDTPFNPLKEFGLDKADV